jgi:hypothetical protein
MMRTPVYKPGDGSDNDPSHLLQTVTNEQIKEWLDDCHAAFANQTGTWEYRFIKSLRMTFEAKLESGYDMHPLSGKQLVCLKSIVVDLAKIVQAEVLKTVHTNNGHWGRTRHG